MLLDRGVASRDPQTGAIFCRRMVRDEENREAFREAGRTGGNPALCKNYNSPGFVYAIKRLGDGAIKIGIAVNVANRMRKIAKTLKGDEKGLGLVPLASMPVDDMGTVESELHRRFSSSRISGEWFKLSSEDEAALIATLKGQKPGPLPSSSKGKARASSSSSVSTSANIGGRASRPRDEAFEALCEVCGWDYKTLTRSGRGKVNSALSEIRQVAPDVTAGQIRHAAHNYSRKYQGGFGPNAISSHWAECATGQPEAERAKDAARSKLLAERATLLALPSTDDQEAIEARRSRLADIERKLSQL